MSVFREQMRLVDSLQKANTIAAEGNDKAPATMKEGRSNEVNPLKDSTFKPLHVSLTSKAAAALIQFVFFKQMKVSRQLLIMKKRPMPAQGFVFACFRIF
jgi:hypothetical protein